MTQIKGVFESTKIESPDNSPVNSHEQVVFCNDPSVGLKAIISMHSTVLGPATGGCRMWSYANEQEALTDALRLSKGMTYKAAISGLNWGGGKAVIIGDPKSAKNPAMLERFGEYVNRLGGNYITAKDVGIGCDDLRIVKRKTKHVLGIDGEPGTSGDPSPATAWGVYNGMKSAAQAAFGSPSLKGLKIALQGLGTVSFYLLDYLVKEGAFVVGCDIDTAMVERAVKKYGIETIHPDAIYDVKCDLFSPSALGASINPETLPRIQTKIIAGAANNQLATPEMGVEVMKRGILYAPDYAINAGGLINIYHEGMEQGGYNHDRAFSHVQKIGQTMTQIFERAKGFGLPPHVIADQMAEERINVVRRH